MVSIERISLILIAVAFFAISTFSQSIKITESDLDSIVRSATSASNALPRREKALIQIFNEKGLLRNTTVFNRIFLPPNKSQTFYSYRNQDSGDVSESETITIGSDFYVKEKNENWKLERASYPPPPKAIPVSAPADEVIKIVFRKNVELGDRMTDFYEMKKTGTRVNRNGKYKSTEITRYWINKDGTLAKLQTEATPSSSNQHYQRTLLYEYDPTIKIEAPIK